MCMHVCVCVCVCVCVHMCVCVCVCVLMCVGVFMREGRYVDVKWQQLERWNIQASQSSAKGP